MSRRIAFLYLALVLFLIACGSDSDTNDDELPTHHIYDNGTISFFYPFAWEVDEADGQFIVVTAQAEPAAAVQLINEELRLVLLEVNAVLDFELEPGIEPQTFLEVMMTNVDDAVFGERIDTSLGGKVVSYVDGHDGQADVRLLVIGFDNDNFVLMTGVAGEGALERYQAEFLSIAESLSFSPSPTLVTVADLSWERTITIEQFQTFQEEEWCDNVPSVAYDLTRGQRQRGTERVPDGEECRTVSVDNGDGTFTEQNVCETIYREEPIFDDYCDYTIDRWVVSGQVTTTGGSGDEHTEDALDLQGGEGLGAERETGRETHYYVELVGFESGGVYQCEVTEDEWRGFDLEAQWTLTIGFMSDKPDCSSLQVVHE